MMHGLRESDSPIVPEKLPNKGDGNPSSAERVEGRGLAKRNAEKHPKVRTQCRVALPEKLQRIRQASKKKGDPLTATAAPCLFHRNTQRSLLQPQTQVGSGRGQSHVVRIPREPRSQSDGLIQATEGRDIPTRTSRKALYSETRRTKTSNRDSRARRQDRSESNGSGAQPSVRGGV